MSRFVWMVAVTMSLVYAGCKPAESPRASGDSKRTKEKKQKSVKPRVRKPEQPPVVGRRDVANADRDELIQCLGHQDMAVKQEAADRLLAQGPDAVALLIKALDHENYHVRAGAVFALSRFGSEAKSASAKLEKLAEEDQWEVVRDAARFALHSINTK